MRIIFNYIIVLIGVLFLSAFTKDIATISENVSVAIQKGDAKTLSSYFNSTVDLVLPNYNGAYSKAQADIIMKDFFKKYPPKSFKLVHKGVSGDGDEYAIGDYVSNKGKFRVYFLIKKFKTTYLIQQLRFEAE